MVLLVKRKRKAKIENYVPYIEYLIKKQWTYKRGKREKSSDWFKRNKNANKNANTNTTTMAKKTKKEAGGLKGFLTKAGSSFYKGGMVAKDWGWWAAQKSGRIGFIVATTSIVVLMPLVFEISRETTVSMFVYDDIFY